MEAEKLPITKGNRLIKKRFNLLMKEHKDFFEEKEPNHFFRVKDHFMQWIYVWIDSMGGYPRVDCIIQPAFLPELECKCYAACECIRFKEMLPREKQKIDFFFVRVVLPNEKTQYSADKLDIVWENNKYFIEEIAIPHMDQLDFNKTIEMLKGGKDKLFEAYNRNSEAMRLTFAVACLLRGEYEEGYQKLLEVKDHFIGGAERIIDSSGTKISEEVWRLIRIYDRKALEEARSLSGYCEIYQMMDSYDMIAKAEYIKELLTILEQKKENWEGRLKERIEFEEKCSVELLKKYELSNTKGVRCGRPLGSRAACGQTKRHRQYDTVCL